MVSYIFVQLLQHICSVLLLIATEDIELYEIAIT